MSGYNSVGREPDDGRPDEFAFECPECGSTNTVGPDGEGLCDCLECVAWFAVEPDSFDYPED
jgi:hypothetical protein